VIAPNAMSSQAIYVVDGARSPFLKARREPGPFSAGELAVQTGRALLLRQPFAPTAVDEVILGCAAPAADETNIGRILALRLGCGLDVPGYTVMRNCASGMQALHAAMQSIREGRSHLVLAGGTEAMSRAPVMLDDAMVRWLARWSRARGLRRRLSLLRGLRPRMFRPVPALLKGLHDPVAGVSMGQTAENLAHAFSIPRTAMDAFAARSHVLAHRARVRHVFEHEIIPLVDERGRLYDHDDGVREDSTPGRLARLRPVFDPPWGNITAGNSSQVTDGAALLLLASEAAIERHGLQPLGRIVDVHWAALDPAIMGLGPVHAASPLLQRHGLGLNDIDIWELNEAFAAQVLACLQAWQDEDWCRQHLGQPALGALDMDRLNVDGGAIALGHPVGASGARIVLHCLNVLRDRGLSTGMANICIGGGQGGAMLLQSCAPSAGSDTQEAAS